MSGVEDGVLSELLWAVARRLRAAHRETLEPLGVLPSQGRALGVLMRRGPLRPGALAEALGIAARSATEVVDVLEGRGLVARAPDPGDRRATLVALTETGRELGKRIRETRQAETERFFGALGEDDREELARLLRLLKE
jgi:DNA-binding MarR family transcriptional regulator